MDSFLDSTVIIKYFEYEYIKEHLRKKCFDYIKSSNGKILISFIIKEELRRAILKRKEIYDYVLKKMNDSSYELDYRKTISLNKEDSIFAKNLYLKLKEKDAIKLKKDFDSEIGFLNVSLSIFLKNKVNEIVRLNPDKGIDMLVDFKLLPLVPLSKFLSDMLIKKRQLAKAL